MLILNESLVMMREAVVRIPMSEYPISGLEEFVSLCRKAGVTGWTPTVCTGPGAIVAIQVKRPFNEERLSALEYVVWWERIDRTEADVGYIVKLDVPGLPDRLPSLHKLQVSNKEVTITDYGLDISLAGTQDVLSEVISKYTDAGVPMVLQAISDYRGPSGVLDTLTDRQHEVVYTAYEMGYYEIPRRSSTMEVAGELNLDQSTVSEHLQRAERNLLSAILDAK